MIPRLLSALSKHGTYQKLRKAVLRIRRSPLLNSYSYWIKNFESREIDQFLDVADNEAAGFSDKDFVVVMPIYNTKIDYLGAAIDSLQNQSHKNWQLIFVVDGSVQQETRDVLVLRESSDSRISLKAGTDSQHSFKAINSVLQDVKNRFVIFFGQHDLLHPRALECLAVAISSQPLAKLLYTDQDKIDGNGTRLEPYFKPKWSPELLLSQNYVNHLTCWSSDCLNDLNYFREDIAGAQDHDLLLRAAREILDEDVFHIPFPLYHLRAVDRPDIDDKDNTESLLEQGKQAVADYWSLSTNGCVDPEISVDSQHHLYHSRLELQTWPCVTLVVPHRDSPLLLESILELWTKTDYPNLELVLVDHSSTNSETRKMLSELVGTDRVTICEYEGAFNFSRMCNLGVKSADLESHICFMNNDVQLLDFNWLKNLVPYLEISGVVAVGPLLLYPDFSIQHAGIALGIGGFAGHYFKHLPYGAPSYQRWAYSTRNASALTGAALLTRRSDFDSVGGFDEEMFPTSFSDVDLCLKLSQHGRLVYCADSKLIHLESQTRPKTNDLEDIQRLRNKWGNEIDSDPYFPTIFSRLTESMTPNYRRFRPFR